MSGGAHCDDTQAGVQHSHLGEAPPRFRQDGHKQHWRQGKSAGTTVAAEEVREEAGILLRLASP